MTNTETALSYLRHLEKGDLEGALALAHDDACFWTPGPGDMNKQQFREFFVPVGAMIQSIQFTFFGTTAEGDRVAVEAASHAQLKNGREYRNQYHFLFELDGGKLRSVREYADSAPAITAFFAPDAA
ncbi:hypothetical protein CIC12_20335 [Burkholderia sp. SG-MS1]|uniref:nuclear transport factor 2 family protein n=1 Tax=Paraburkholderia sp. SG-MS1 TaxID=2023741 RepID=UPI001445D910|nr:nuclear transport factor 2 family protein [Paraburkholderia sp. SG-MS1]NKJ49041.1 hypothetical protein [Paraburkholderia sp. SG-MS1]